MPIPAGPETPPDLTLLPPEASMVVADIRIPELAVYDRDGNPGDHTTTATCTVRAPAGTLTALASASADGGANWTAAAWTATTAGRWVETWTVVGRGADTLHAVVLVHATPDPGGQTWIPTREQVAAYVPKKTHVGATTGWGRTMQTFTPDTRPAAATVDVLISQAAQWIELLAGPITTVAVVDGARTAAAMRVAGLICYQFPDGPDDKAYGDRLLAEAKDLRRDVAAANIVVTGEDPVADAVLPYWSFPAAPADAPW